IRTMTAGGEPLSASARSFFETRFGYDFGHVRLHTGAGAAGAALTPRGRAFPARGRLFFGAGEDCPPDTGGRRLLAHELTHTIQQQPSSARVARLLRAQIGVQRGWFGDLKAGAVAAALGKVRAWADKLPPYELFTVLLGVDPITEKPIEKSA